MSEYQYYEFRAIDQPLNAAAMEKLREISSRAEITPTSFINEYHWGDFHGNVGTMMERWFDMHLYFAHFGIRQLMMKLPRQRVDTTLLETLTIAVDAVEITESGKNLIIDIRMDDESDDRHVDCDEDEACGWLAELVPLRDDVLSGDSRMLYLLWLVAVENGSLTDDAVEPLPGIGPMTKPLKTFADFLMLDPRLVRVAAEKKSGGSGKLTKACIRRFVSDLPDAKKEKFLSALIEEKPNVLAEVRAEIRKAAARESGKSEDTRRTAGELRVRADKIRK